MRKMYVALSGLLLLAVVAQFFFAGVGAFDKPRGDDSFAVHAMIGMMVIPLLALLATVVAAVARAPGGLIGLTALPIGLASVQMLFRPVIEALTSSTADATTTAGTLIFGLHALNGLVIMGVVGAVLARARSLARSDPPAEPVAAATS